MDHKLERELIKLHEVNFQKASDIKETLEALMEQCTTAADIGLCSSKIFDQNQGFFIFLERHVGERDSLMAETRKALYKLISQYMKRHKQSTLDYLELIQDRCSRLFKREDSNKCKGAALWPIIAMLKHFPQRDTLLTFLQPKQVAAMLLDDIKFCKPAPTVKGVICYTLGLVVHCFSNQIDETGRDVKLEMFILAHTQLIEQARIDKPELVYIEGLLKFFRYALPHNRLNRQQTSEVFVCLKVFMIVIKDVATYKIVNAAIKCLRDNIETFAGDILHQSDEMFKKLIELMIHDKREVKENASELFELFIQTVSEKLDQDENRHKRIFNQMLDQFIEILQAKQQNLFLLTVVIRSVGLFAKAMVRLRGEKYLAQFFNRLIELGEENVLNEYERFYEVDRSERQMKRGVSFKAVLYRQKQLNSFVTSYGHVVRSLNKLDDNQVQHLYAICILSIKQHYNYFDNYKQYLYDALVNVLLAIQQHTEVATQFMERLFTSGLEEGLKMFNDMNDFISTCQEMSRLWKGIIQHKSWTNHTLIKFTDCLFKQVNHYVLTTNFESKLQQLQQAQVGMNIELTATEFRHVALFPNGLTFFHRMTLVFSAILPIIPLPCATMHISYLLKNTYQKIKQYPKSVLLLIFARTLMRYVRDYHLLNNQELNQNQTIILTSFVHKLIHLLISNLKVYTNQLQIEALSVLVNVPTYSLIQQNYSLLKSKYVDVFKQAFEHGKDSLHLSTHALELLVSLVEHDRKNAYAFKQLLKILSGVIPCLSPFMQALPMEQPIYEPIKFIDSTSCKLLLSEVHMTSAALVDKVQYFLGSIGGLCHMIVDEQPTETLLAWDYNSPITFDLTIGGKGLTLRISSMLGRALILCQEAQSEKIKVLAGEMLHGFIIYMIGKSATRRKRKDQDSKSEYANIYMRVFPVMLSVACSQAHPCKSLFSMLLMQIARWLANTKEYEAQDVSQFLDTIMELPIQHQDMEQYCSQLLGEFVKWTLKQSSAQEIQRNYSNIKTVFRRITTMVSHPDVRYKSMGLQCIVQFLEQTQGEKFLVDKYYIELSCLIRLALGDTINNKVNDRIIDILSKAFGRFAGSLYEDIKRTGRFSNLNALLGYLHDEAMCGKDEQWQQIALQLWIQSIECTYNTTKCDVRMYLLKLANNSKSLFNKQPIQRRFFEVSENLSDNPLLENGEYLAWQCRIWVVLINSFTPNELTKFRDFDITIDNLQDFFRFFIELKQTNKQREDQFGGESSLFSVLLNITQENFNPSQNNDRITQYIQSSLPEQLIEQFLRTFSRVFTFLQHFNNLLDSNQFIRVGCGLLMKPTYYLMGVQIEQYQQQLDELSISIQQVIKATLPQDYYINILIPTLYEIFGIGGIDEGILEILQYDDKHFKDNSELKCFLYGLLWNLEVCNKEVAIVQLVNRIGQLVFKRHIEQSTQIDVDKNAILLEFALSSRRANEFVLEHLQQQSVFKQKYEDILLQYVANNFQQVGQQFFILASNDISMLRYSLSLINMMHKNQQLTQLPPLNINRTIPGALIIEIQLNYLILHYTLHLPQEYMLDLLSISLKGNNSIEIHMEALLLLGLYCRSNNIDAMKYLVDIRNKYFPIQVKDLIKGSQPEINFNAILQKIIEMIKLAGKIQLTEVLFGLVRQEVNLDAFIKDYLRDNFQVDQYSQIQWMMEQVQDIELDKNPLQNVRIALANQFLIPMITNSNCILQYFIQYTPYLIEVQSQKSDDNWNVITLWLKFQTLVFDLFAVAYKHLTAEQIKNELHSKLYNNSQGNELTKQLIATCLRVRKTVFEKTHLLEAAAKQYTDLDYQKIIQQYHAAAYVALIYIMMATQTKDNLFVQFLLQAQPEKREILYDGFIDKDWQFNFQVETEFVEIPFLTSLIKGNQVSDFQNQVVQHILSNTMMSTPQVHTQIHMEIEQPEQPTEQLKIEMDLVNQHKVMIPMLQLVDFLHAKFPAQNQNEMPNWMTYIWKELLAQKDNLGVRVFLIKLIINRIQIFSKYPSSWLEPLLLYCSSENKLNGGKGFHYFLRDVIVTIIQLSANAQVREEYLRNYPQSKFNLCSVANKLIALTANPNPKLFQQNIEILEMFIGQYKEHIYLQDTKINQQIQNEKKADSELWQANGLAVLRIALTHGVRILGDYQEFTRSANAAKYEKYRYLLQRNSQVGNFPSEYLIRVAQTYVTKKPILKAIAGAFGSALEACDVLEAEDVRRDYENQICKLCQNVLSDSRPGYGREKFTDFVKIVCKIHPKVLNHSILFQTTANQITLATSKERVSILAIFDAYVQKIEKYSNQQQFQINEIAITVQGALDKIVRDTEVLVHQSVLSVLKQLASQKCLNLSTQTILNAFRIMLPELEKHYGRHHEIAVATSYQQILTHLHEYLVNYEDKQLMALVTTQLLATFSSQHGEIRKTSFEYFQQDMEKRAIQVKYLQNKETNTMDMVVTLMQDIYQPEQESLWLRSAVPLLLSQSKRNSNYDSLLFHKPLDEEAQYYDMEFKGAKYFRQANFTQQQYGTQFSSSLLSQVVQPIDGGIRATMESQQPQQSQQLSQQMESLSQQQNVDADGFLMPSNKKTHMSHFLRNNQLSFSQVTINSNNRLRYTSDKQMGMKEHSRVKYQQQQQINSFARNQIRKYRIGELPDILIKSKDIIDPIIELCFEDEDMAGLVFTGLIKALLSEDSPQQFQGLLLGLLSRSKQKNFLFITTMLKTLHQVTVTENKPLQQNEIVKRIGLDSLAYFQSMILIEENIRILDNFEDERLMTSWMDLLDLHQHTNNQAQVRGILDIVMKSDGDTETEASKQINDCISKKHQHNYLDSQLGLKQLLDKFDTEVNRSNVDYRIYQFIQAEYEDSLRKLGKWDDVDTTLTQTVCNMTKLEVQAAPVADVKRVFHNLLRVHQDGHPDIQKANEIYYRIKDLNEYAFEKAQLQQAQLDVDQARYYCSQSQINFQAKWTQITSQNKLLSKPLRHRHLEELQLIHELSELQRIFSGGEIDMEERQRVFDAWSTRPPSLQFDSLETWQRVYQSRRLMVHQLNMQDMPIYEGQWAIQIAQGLVKMHYYDQVQDLIGHAYRLQQSTDQQNRFDWNFYSTLATVKLKQLELKVEQINRSELIQSLSEITDIPDPKKFRDEREEHISYIGLFKKEYEKYKDIIKQPEILIKFKLLPLKCYENYTKINQDIIFLLAQLQKSGQYRNNQGFRMYYERFGSIMIETISQYEKSNMIIVDDYADIQLKFYRNAAAYCERCLRLVEPDSGGSEDLRKLLDQRNVSLDRIADLFVKYTINSFKAAKSQDFKSNNLLIKMLKVVQKFPNQIGSTFQNAIEKNYLPSWIFLQYLPQIIHIINNDRFMPYFKDIFKEFVKKYPEQLIYQFNVSFENIEQCKNLYSKNIFNELQKKLPQNYDFIKALNQITHPQHRLLYYLQLIKENITSPDLNDIVQSAYSDVFSKNKKITGPISDRFTQAYESKFRSMINKLSGINDVNKLVEGLRNEKIESGRSSLTDFSNWFFTFKDVKQDERGVFIKPADITIPMRIVGMSEIDLKTLPKIASFDSKVLTLTSLRKPKRIRVFGSDEKTYQFLVKGIEDLRLDQRVEQLFEVMNSLHQESQIATFAVIPMSNILGLLEWVDQTSTLKEILEKEFQADNPGSDLHDKNPAYKSRVTHVEKAVQKYNIWPGVPIKDIPPSTLHKVLLYVGETEIRDKFKDQQNYISSSLLRSGLINMSSSLEAFVFIRDHFLANYAVVCAAGYILGIGDRHLENFLLNYSTGEVVIIDFGYSFGSAIGLPIPELMPFRLTQVFEGLSKPVGLGGIFRNEFIKVMTQFREKRHILLDFCEVFVNDPLLDQLKLAKDKAVTEDFLSQMHQQLRLEEEIYSKGTDTKQSESMEESPLMTGSKRIQEVWYPMKKIDIVRKKLIGVHCSLILQDELEESRHSAEKYTQTLREAIVGKRSNSQRYQILQQKNLGNLSVIEQVDCLIDMATDHNILGRAWLGWTGYV